jgi:hypothetical protein
MPYKCNKDGEASRTGEITKLRKDPILLGVH